MYCIDLTGSELDNCLFVQTKAYTPQASTCTEAMNIGQLGVPSQKPRINPYHTDTKIFLPINSLS